MSAKELLGEVVWGIIGTDRYAAYNWINPRQLCWAHPIRTQSSDCGLL
jgi:hypothetical protein